MVLYAECYVHYNRHLCSFAYVLCYVNMIVTMIIMVLLFKIYPVSLRNATRSFRAIQNRLKTSWGHPVPQSRPEPPRDGMVSDMKSFFDVLYIHLINL